MMLKGILYVYICVTNIFINVILCVTKIMEAIMYAKNLTEDLRLRLDNRDMEFLRSLSAERGQSVSACIRGIIGEYRRNIVHMEVELSNGDTKTYINNIV